MSSWSSGRGETEGSRMGCAPVPLWGVFSAGLVGGWWLFPGLTISFSGQIPVFTGNEISFRNFGKFRGISVNFGRNLLNFEFENEIFRKIPKFRIPVTSGNEKISEISPKLLTLDGGDERYSAPHEDSSASSRAPLVPPSTMEDWSLPTT